MANNNSNNNNNTQQTVVTNVDIISSEISKQNDTLRELMKENAHLNKTIYERTSYDNLKLLKENVTKQNENLKKVIEAINEDFKDIGIDINNIPKGLIELNKRIADVQVKITNLKRENKYHSKDKDIAEANHELEQLNKAYRLLEGSAQSFYSAANASQKELNRRSREGITALHDWDESFKQKTEYLRKGFGEIKSGASQAISSLTKGLEPWKKANHEAMTYAKNVGMSQRATKEFLDRTVEWTAENDIGLLFNKSTDELIKLQNKYSEVLGRNVQLSGEQMKDVLALETFLGEDGATDLVNNLENFGLGAADTADFVHKTMSEATKHGIVASKLTKTIKDNIKMAQNYSFKNGLEGLSSMAKKALELKTDLSLVNGFIEKTATVEGAITTGANLQVLGGTYAMGSDPLSMMYESLNDVEGMFDRAVEMAKGKVFFNEASGQFEMGAMDRYLMKQAATQMGVDPSKMIDVAFRQASLGRIEGAINQNTHNISSDEDMVQLIKNIATFKDGEAFVNINGQDKKVTDLTMSDKNSLEASSRTDSENLQDMAISLRSLNEKLGGFEKNTQNKQASIVAPVAEKLDDLLANNTEILSDVSGIMAYLNTITAAFGAIGGIWATILGISRVISGTNAMILQAVRFLGLKKGIPGGAMGAAGTPGAGSPGTGILSRGGALASLKTGAKIGGWGAALTSGIMLTQDIMSGDFSKDKNTSLIDAGFTGGGAFIGGLAGGFIGGPVGAMIGSTIGAGLGQLASSTLNKSIKEKGDKVRQEIAEEFARTMPDFKNLFVGDNALQGNYSERQLNKIKEALQDKIVTKDEMGWWDFSELESNGDLERLRNAGVEVRMAAGGVLGSNGGRLSGKSHNEGGMPILGSNITVEGGEYVVNKQATQDNLPLLEKINSGSYKFTPIEPLGKQLTVQPNTNSNTTNSQTNNSKVEIPPISIDLSGTIKLDTGNTTVDVSRNILNNPELISKLTNMIAKQLNIIDFGSYNKGYFKQKFI